MEWKTGSELAKLTGNKRMSRKALKKAGYGIGKRFWNSVCYMYEVWKEEN